MELLGFQILYSSTGEGRGGLDDTLTCVGSTIFNARIKTFFCPENGDQDPAPRVEVGQRMTYGTIDVSPEFPTGYCRAQKRKKHNRNNTRTGGPRSFCSETGISSS